jgi:Flp pilus assembly protein TadD
MPPEQHLPAPPAGHDAGGRRPRARRARGTGQFQPGRAPDDPLLAQAEQRFFETLAIDPTDPSALNGLGSILMYRRDLEAAEFFILAAIAQADRQNIDYPAAQHDLALVRRFKRN